ncbi:MAG: M20/M25/M40 family metallo-hydrolase [Kofleriaceae bacterium]|nr:M20/M25/M40 family metallo-hydrolase [Kofleriaceae bacterium]
MMLPSSVEAALATRLPELWPLLERWVEINSFTGNVPGCDAMAAELEAAFALPGLLARSEPGQAAGRHVAFMTPAYLAGQREVILIGHHDTVFPPGTFEHFRCDADHVYGPGVLDMKGGLAVVRTALAVLSDCQLLAGRGIAIVSVSDEETGSVDGQRLLNDLAPGAAAALVFEAGRVADAIVVARKGTGKLRVSVVGRAAHAGNDLRVGINAIWALSRFVDRISNLSVDDGRVTVNVGLIQGGTSANTVPAAARCEIDVRMVHRADGEALLAAMQTIADEIATATGAAFHFEGGIKRLPLETTSASRALAQRYGVHAQRYGLGQSLAGIMGGGSDANTTAALGVPSIDGLGPRGKGFHTHQEFAEIATFEPKVRALVSYLLDAPMV